MKTTKILKHKNGAIRRISNYKNNIKHGTETAYLDNGDLIYKVQYENGKQTKGFYIIFNDKYEF